MIMQLPRVRQSKFNTFTRTGGRKGKGNIMKNSSFSGRRGQLLRFPGLCLAAFGMIGLICFPALGVSPATDSKETPANIKEIQAAQSPEPVMSQQLLDQSTPKNGYYDLFVYYYRYAIDYYNHYCNHYPNYAAAGYYYYMHVAYYYYYVYTSNSYYYSMALDCYEAYVQYFYGGQAEIYADYASRFYQTYKDNYPNYAAFGYYYYMYIAYYYYYRFTGDSGYYYEALDLYELAQYYYELYLYYGY